jgi:hypothetical protein
MKEQLRKMLQSRLEILKDEIASLPAGMKMDPKQLLRETIEEDLAIARVDGNHKEIEECSLSLELVDQLE